MYILYCILGLANKVLTIDLTNDLEVRGKVEKVEDDMT